MTLAVLKDAMPCVVSIISVWPNEKYKSGILGSL
jgi:hypothetical protein